LQEGSNDKQNNNNNNNTCSPTAAPPFTLESTWVPPTSGNRPAAHSIPLVRIQHGRLSERRCGGRWWTIVDDGGCCGRWWMLWTMVEFFCVEGGCAAVLVNGSQTYQDARGGCCSERCSGEPAVCVATRGNTWQYVDTNALYKGFAAPLVKPRGGLRSVIKQRCLPSSARRCYQSGCWLAPSGGGVRNREIRRCSCHIFEGWVVGAAPTPSMQDQGGHRDIMQNYS
jgi:hypothetical protein